MALIGKIRKNNWLLILLIGLGLAAFIMMDSMSGDRSIGATSGSTIGNIAGNKISYPDFDRQYQVRSKSFQSNDSYAQRASLWNYLVEKSIIQNESEALGLGVSTKELKDLQFGSVADLSPLMASRFPAGGAQQQFNPNPQPDMQRILQFKQMIEDDEVNGEPLSKDFVDFWSMHEGEVRKERIQAKLNTLVSKSMYNPSWMVEKAYADQNQRITFEYVKIPFDEVQDSEVTVEDADLTSYLNANAAKYMQDEETRKVGYVTFNVTPSNDDSLAIKKDVVALGNEFAAKTDADDIDLYIESNFGTKGQGWMTADQLNAAIQTSAFEQEIGSVTAPYLEGRAYSVAKILDRRVLPDSATVRHILLGDPNLPRGQKPFEAQYLAWEKRADSLKTVIEAGGDFTALAAEFSTDGGSKDKGGVYEYTAVNMWVPPFNDVAFFSGELNQLYAVRTDFGVHLIEPLGRKTITNTERVKVAYLSKNVIPSKKTTKAVYGQATEFIRNNKNLEAMKTAAEGNSNIEYTTSNPVTANAFSIQALGSSEDSRKMIKFAFENSVGDVSSDVYSFQDQIDFYDNKYIVSGVDMVQKAGKASLENVRDIITPLVRNMKKGEIIKGKINTQDLASIASTFQTDLDTASNVNFSSSSVPGLGQEPNVVAAAFSVDENSVASPVIGANGVFVVKTTSKPAATPPSNIPSIRNTIRLNSQNQVRTAVMQSMKKNADIDDKRSNFF
ncbi:MAG: peptidylprolyl isomerase [Saprospiraceae bacterium]